MENTKEILCSPEMGKPQQGRDKTLDILKGIGIVLMVLGHSGTAFESFIYLFHMALFFMASGYVWNDKKVADLPTLGKSILARVRGLWLPYTLANGCFTLLNNVFVYLGIYRQDKLMTLPQIAVNFCKNLLFAGDTQMGGASWFLRCLFFISVGHLVLRYVVVRWKYGKVLFGVVAVAAFLGAEVVNRTYLKLPMGVETCFCGYSAFLMGMALRKFDIAGKLEKWKLTAAAVSFVVLLLLNRVDNIGLGAGNISSLPFFVVVSLAGWLLVWGVSTLVKGKAADFMCYCGKNSIWIVMLHFISFKPVAWLYLTLTGGDPAGLSQFPVYAAPWLWVAYGVAGTILPLLLCRAISAVRKRLATN